MSEEPYLTTADVLTYLHMTPRTLYRRLSKREIPAVRIGHQWRFRKSELDRWAEQQSLGCQTLDGQSPDVAGPRRVLVAHDEPSVCSALKDILAMVDCTVECVSDGLAAVARLSEASYDLVITDLSMRGLEGIGVAREAKRLHADIKVLIVTAYPTQARMIDAVNLRVDGLITKPFRAMDVLISTARALDL